MHVTGHVSTMCHHPPSVSLQQPAVTSVSSGHISKVKCKGCIHYKELRSSHLKVRLQLFMNSGYSRDQKNIPGNKQTNKKPCPVPPVLQPLPVGSQELHAPPSSPDPQQHPSKTAPPLHVSSPSFLGCLTLPRTLAKEGRQTMGNELNSSPASSPDPDPPHFPTSVYAQQSPSLFLL